ncbi:MAG: hypothetical protein ACM3PY_21340, partial [Omnitrophica WOR_2 bacterium]
MDHNACTSSINCSRRLHILGAIVWIQLLAVIGLSACQHTASAHSPEDEKYLPPALISPSPVVPDLTGRAATNP